MQNNYVARLATNYQNSLLPLYKKVVFVDWHGVLSNDFFWSHVLERPTHPLYERVNLVRDAIFSEKTTLVSDWMRGILTAQQVVHEAALNDDHEKLLNSLMLGCKNMSVHHELLKELQKVRTRCFVVLATDNMDCFFDNIDNNKSVSGGFDSLLCSSKIGVLKSEDPKRFFKPWLERHNLTFSDATLFDDSPTNCKKFEKQGGTAILVTSVDQCLKDLKLMQ